MPQRPPYTRRADGWHSDLEMLAARYGLWRTDQDWTGRPPIEVPVWTIAYKKTDELLFHRVTDWKGTWQEAHDKSGEFGVMHPEQDLIFYTTTRDAELTDYVGREDVLNIMIEDGSRVLIADDGTIA